MSAKNVSVTKQPLKHLMLYILSHLYLRLSGMMAERTPCWVVASIVRVALALLGPMCHNSASELAVRSAWRLVDTKVRRAGSETNSNSDKLEHDVW